MKKFILANWKCHKTTVEAVKWFETFSDLYQPNPDVKVIIAPPIIALPSLKMMIQERKITSLSLAAQDISPFPLGSYTGAVAAEMLQGMVEYVIVGHSERRRYFHETHQEIANKVSEALAAEITPIVCLDIPYARAQIAAIQEDDAKKIFIGYGPVEAIGINNAQSPERTSSGILKIESLVEEIPILYGGSINEKNCTDYVGMKGLAGLMVGSASLDPIKFASICKKMR
jgi:triosephosphate isomerase